MSRKTMYFGLAALLGLFAAIVLIGGLSWGHKAPAGVGILPVRDGSPEQGKSAPAAVNAKAHALISDFGRVPVLFVPNRGQTDDRVSFTVRGADKTVYFAPEGVTFALSYPAHAGNDRESERYVVKLDFLGSRQDVEPEGLEKTGASISYFRGKPEEWKTGLPAYSRIIYRDLWPGIDLAYMGESDKLKYEFIVHPGADPSKIRLAYRGAERVALTEEGRLEVKTPAGGFEDDIPVAYQEVDGERISTPVTYSLEYITEGQSSAAASGPGITQADGSDSQSRVYGFVVGEYDRNRSLVLDPAVLVYCGYIGGASDLGDAGRPIAVDNSGNAYVAGITNSNELTFPTKIGPDLTYNGGDGDAFVAKVDSTGTGLVYCGYIGGAGQGETALGIAVDSSGNAYVAGLARSDEGTFPVTVGPDLTYNGGDGDIFVAKVNPSGTGLAYCGYIGGSGDEHWCGIAVDDLGNAYVSGRTTSDQTTFPVAVGPDLTFNGVSDAFVAKVNPAGTVLLYCGYIGGNSDEDGNGIAVDSSGNAYVTGNVHSTESTFPVKIGPDLTHNGGGDVFVAKVNPSGSELVYCGYIGGNGQDSWPKIAVDGSGNAYISGGTNSTPTTFPVKIGPDLTYNGSGELDAFVAKINPSGSALVYCGYIGGSASDEGTWIAVDNSGNAYTTGTTGSSASTFPVVDGPDLTLNGGNDIFVAKVNSSGTALVYCGYIGGSADELAFGIAVDGSGNAYVTGMTWSDQATFPVSAGPDVTYNGGGDAFVAKVGDVPGPPITSLLPDSADAGDPGLLLSVIGSDFVDGAVVRWDGSSRPTTFVSSSELDATIDTSDLVAGKAVQVTVRNPNGGVSNALPFTIDNPLPSLASVSPTQVTGGGAAFTLTVQGSNFVPNSVVRWNGSDRATTCISATELQAAILSADIAAGGDAQVTVSNPAPSGGVTSALAVQVSSFTLSASPTSLTVTAGQSATFTIQLTPQYGPFDSPVTFSCTGLPSKCTASFSPASVTPGASSVTTTLTLTTKAASSSAGATLFRATGLGLPTLGLLAIGLTMLLGNVIRKRVPWRLNRRWLAACALICLVILIGSCSSGGDDNPLYTGTPKGTHQISVQGTSGNMTIPTVVTLVVN